MRYHAQGLFCLHNDVLPRTLRVSLFCSGAFRGFEVFPLGGELALVRALGMTVDQFLVFFEEPDVRSRQA